MSVSWPFRSQRFFCLSKMNNSPARQASLFWPISAFFLCAFSTVVAFYAAFQNIKEDDKTDTNRTLVSVGQLKTNQIQSYLTERTGDAAVVSRFLATPAAQNWLLRGRGN